MLDVKFPSRVNGQVNYPLLANNFDPPWQGMGTVAFTFTDCGSLLYLDRKYSFGYNIRMNAIRDLRRKAGLTQAKLARIAGTSQPTIAAYETGRKSPTLQTLSRIARTVGLEAMVSFVTVMTREDRRSLVLHRAIADRLIKEPTEVLKHAQRNLSLMWDRNPHAHKLFAEWRSILSRPIDKIVTAVLDSDLHGRDLRKVTPFAGVLSTNERTRVYRNFARRDVGA